jgi:hypothetical protein
MSDRGLVTPVQPVRPRGAHGTIAVGVAALAVIGLLVWHPWAGAPTRPDQPDGPVSSVPGVAVASGVPMSPGPRVPVGPDASTDPDLFGGPTTGPWSGRVTGEWSIVAFLRSDPVSRDPLNLRQQQVAVLYGQPESVGLTDAICDQEGTFLHRAAADLPTREVRYLGIAFPPEESVAVRRIARLGEYVPALPVEIGRIPGGGAIPTPTPAATPTVASTQLPRSVLSTPGPLAGTTLDKGSTGGGGANADEGTVSGPVRELVQMFALPGGGPWPDGVYRFDVSTHEGLPTALFACIRP